MQFDKIISVCKRTELDLWKVTSSKIIRNLKSKRYIVIVPKDDLQSFEEISPINYEVISEEFYSECFLPSLQKKAHNSSTQLGWYIQQFIKFSALMDIQEGEIALIWDADTVPLKKIEFEKNGKIIFYTGKEHHKPYFDTIKNLLSIEKKNEYSFIAQCIPCKGKWIKSLLGKIEENGKPWYQSIIDSIDFSKASSFSEYETLGTFIEANFPSEIQITKNNWQRYGNGLIGSVKNLEYFSKILSIKYDFISFEKWDHPYSIYKNRISKYFRKASRK